MSASPLFIDNVNRRLVDDLRITLKSGSRVAVAGAVFSLYAYAAMRKELKDVKDFRFIFTSPVFSQEKTKKEQREFFIPRLGRERALCGTPFEIKLRNQLTQKAVARECAEWIRTKARFKTSLEHDAMSGELLVGSAESISQYFPLKEFTTTTLGLERSDAYCTQIMKLPAPASVVAMKQFDSIWQDECKLRDVTDEVLGNFEALYCENSPELIYFVTLVNIFSRFLDDISEDVLPNEGTGYRESVIWQKLYNFQRDAALAIINKLEQYNGCILADSVGLGKTFTALAVIKYYESRNKSVLVLCPKKLHDNWSTYRNNYSTNILSADRFRYDVLFHSDLSRKSGFSNGIDLGCINWGNYDLVVIDESHNFRNGFGTQAEHENRYSRLMNQVIKAGVKTKVLMLSATPVNNRFTDLKNQLQLAYEGEESRINDLLEIQTDINVIFRQAQSAFNRWSKLPTDKRTTEALQKTLPFDFFEILDAVTIARSRRHIEQYYDTTDIGRFPERLPPVTRRPKLTNLRDAPDYKEIYSSIRELNLAVYTPSDFILGSRLSKYADAGGAQGLSLRGRERGIRQLMSVNLLKRLESSVNSFRLTLQRILEEIERRLERVKAFEAKQTASEKFTADEDIPDDLLDADDQSDFAIGTKKTQIYMDDLDFVQWAEYMKWDREVLKQLLARVSVITCEYDGKLHALQKDLMEKIATPVNVGNKKVLIFTAFADTACYLYEHLASFLSQYGIHTGLVTGCGDVKCTIPTKETLDFNRILTLFSPVSKEKNIVCPSIGGEIDVLIGTDCISEGQNLQDCDCVINFDIHWNPVRIIQRFGRIDRIGSKNSRIQMINYWPDLELDEYIDLKARVEARMKASVLSSTGDGNPLSIEEKNELHFREEQLRRLQHEVVDLEDMNSGVAITDLGLNEFRQDLLAYRREHPEVAHMPHGLHAVIPASGTMPEGVIFVLKCISENAQLDIRNRLHPYYLVYIGGSGNVVINHLEPKALLDRIRHVCKGCSEYDSGLCRQFNRETRDGSHMERYSKLLTMAVDSIRKGRQKSNLDSFLDGEEEPLLAEKADDNDFELVTFFIIKEID